jgi:hypothetical protein
MRRSSTRSTSRPGSARRTPTRRPCSSSTSTSIGTGRPTTRSLQPRRRIACALSDGRNLTFVQNLADGTESAFFGIDHNTNSANTVLYACAEQLGLSLEDVGSSFDAAGFAVDFYTSGTVRDTVEFSGVWGGERDLGVVNGSGFGGGPIGTGATVPFFVHDFGATGASADETGVVVRVANGDAATENFTVTVDQP